MDQWLLCRSCRGKILTCSTTHATGCTHKSRGIIVGSVQAVAAIANDESLQVRVRKAHLYALFNEDMSLSHAPNHISREYNTWADELTHPDFEGFSLDRRSPAPDSLHFSVRQKTFVFNRFFLDAQDPVTKSGGTSTGAFWPWEARGQSDVVAAAGESCCLTHLCPPGEVQGRVWEGL